MYWSFPFVNLIQEPIMQAGGICQAVSKVHGLLLRFEDIVSAILVRKLI